MRSHLQKPRDTQNVRTGMIFIFINITYIFNNQNRNLLLEESWLLVLVQLLGAEVVHPQSQRDTSNSFGEELGTYDNQESCIINIPFTIGELT